MRWIVPAALVLATGAFATQAPAATYCVSDAACVRAGGVDRGANLQAALTAATSAAGADTVQIGAGRFSAANGFTATDASAAIAVRGAGRGLTTLAATTADRRVLDFGASSDATVSDLSIAMPPSGGVGVFVPQHIARVTIAGGTGGATGVWTQNTTVDDVTIDLPLDGSSNTGVYRPNGSLTADGLTITAHKGIDGFGVDAYEHLRVRSDGAGIVLGSSLSSALTIDDAQIRMSGAGVGLQLGVVGGSPASLTARFLTVHGDGTSGSTGVESHGSNAGSVASLSLEDSIVAGFDHALRCSITGSGQARLLVRWSAFDPSDLVEGCAAAIDTRTGDIATDPQLQPAANGDLLPAASSPVIDTGDPLVTAPVPVTDLLGNPRRVDGNDNGTVRVDMGAFEYQYVPASTPHPPVVPVVTKPVLPPAGGRTLLPVRPRQPLVTSFSIAPRRFAPLLGRPLARVRGASSRAPHRGAMLTYALSAPAAVRVTVEQALPGHRSGRGRACRAGGRGRRCTRWVLRARLAQIASDALRRSIAFSGRSGARALPAGSYRATIVARGVGAPDSPPRSVRFTLLG
jgi:hypothetical protein